MSKVSNTLTQVTANIRTRAAMRATMKAGELVTVEGLDGIYRITNFMGNTALWAVLQKDGKDYMGGRSFQRSRCTPITAPSIR